MNRHISQYRPVSSQVHRTLTSHVYVDPAQVALARKGQSGSNTRVRAEDEVLGNITATQSEICAALAQDALLQQINELEELRTQIDDILSTSAVPINIRLTRLLGIARTALGMEHGYFSRKSKGRFLLQATSHLALRQLDPDCSNMLTTQIASSGRCFARHCLQKSNLAGTPNLIGELPGRMLGMRIVFDGKVLGTLELTATQSQDHPFTPLDRHILGTIASRAAPFIFLRP